MKNFDYYFAAPAAPSMHRDQADAAQHMNAALAKAVDDGEGAVWVCTGGSTHYVLAGSDDVVTADVRHPAIALLLLENPEKDMSLAEVFESLGWDYEGEKADWAAQEYDLDDVKVGYVNAKELTVSYNS